jgi:hypothetical protein
MPLLRKSQVLVLICGENAITQSGYSDSLHM